jgi:hypothetical protein
MKQSKFSESQIVAILREGDAGVPRASCTITAASSSIAMSPPLSRHTT